MIGKTLKYIREQKNFTATEVTQDILTPSQFSRIENKNQTPAADSFIKLLYRINVSFDEFILLSNDNHAKARIETKNYIANVLRKKNPQQLKSAMAKMDNYYAMYNDFYFNHMSCLLKATLIFSEEGSNFNAMHSALTPISEYLSNRETWFEYEIALFTNCLYLYPLEKAMTLGEEVLNKLKKNYALLKSDEITRGLLVNMAIYALSDAKYYHNAHIYSNAVFSLPQSTNLLYITLLAKIVNQVSCYKLDNGEYDESYLISLINCFKTMRFDDLYKQAIDFITKHDITIDNI